jgi:hypothetical protein
MMATPEQTEQLEREAGNMAIPLEKIKEVFRQNIKKEKTKKYSEIKQSVNLDSGEKNSDDNANTEDDTENQIEGSTINKQKDSIENYRPSQTGHPSSDNFGTGSDQKASSENQRNKTSTDDASISSEGSCPPLQANVPSSMRNQYC